MLIFVDSHTHTTRTMNVDTAHRFIVHISTFSKTAGRPVDVTRFFFILLLFIIPGSWILLLISFQFEWFSFRSRLVYMWIVCGANASTRLWSDYLSLLLFICEHLLLIGVSSFAFNAADWWLFTCNLQWFWAPIQLIWYEMMMMMIVILQFIFSFNYIIIMVMLLLMV